MFVYQPTLKTIESRKDKSTDYFVGWNSKEVYSSKRKLSYTAVLHSIKRSGYRMRIQFDSDILSVEQNNYVTKIDYAYIVYDLDTWRKLPVNKLKIKKLFV